MPFVRAVRTQHMKCRIFSLSDRPVRNRARVLALAWIALSVLAVQSIGLLHRLEHVAAQGWPSLAEHVAAAASPLGNVDDCRSDNRGEAHSCAALDALALAYALTHVGIATLGEPPTAPSDFALPRARALLSPADLYHARAPPEPS